MKASEKKLTLLVETGNESAEVFIIDARFKLVERGRGLKSTFSLSPGIYTVKVRAGFESHKQDVALLDKPERVSFSQIEFASSAPLQKTGKTHEYHMSAAERESLDVHVKAGSGSFIFVCARDWTPSQTSEKTFEVNRKPHIGLKLLDKKGELVADLAKKSKCSDKQDPWAACNVQVNPGIYRLSLELASGDTLEQTIVASRGWQTQIFLLQRNYGENQSDRRADLIGASILISKKGFNPNDPLKRLVEAARLGLVNTRQVLPQRVIDEILNGKVKNPMLGILGAHLLLLGKQVDLDDLNTIVSNLRRLLGHNEHPDVEALALGLRKKATSYVFEHPPMLRRSWWQVVEATVDNKNLVPRGSMAAQCAERIWGEEPWLQWMTPKKVEVPLEAMAEAPALESVIGFEQYLQPFGLGAESTAPTKVSRKARAKKTAAPKAKKGGGGTVGRTTKKIAGGKVSRTKTKTKSFAAADINIESGAILRPTKSQMRQLVKSSGLPWSNVESLLDQRASAPEISTPSRSRKKKT